VQGFGFGDLGFGFRDLGLGFGVWGLGFWNLKGLNKLSRRILGLVQRVKSHVVGDVLEHIVVIRGLGFTPVLRRRRHPLVTP